MLAETKPAFRALTQPAQEIAEESNKRLLVVEVAQPG
jgi:hypothetical protein